MAAKGKSKSNALIYESSPYLLQHAHNPVDWLPWGDDALAKAKAEDKPLLISIGYSACHWCHVMERESFEDEAVAHLMNQNFICIKVDREERPDVDQVYMEAVQMMQQQGGWPLNCVATPEGKPIYGGTYFPKENWILLLGQLAKLWRDDRQKALEYGAQVAEAMQVSGAMPALKKGSKLPNSILENTIANWQQRFDPIYGGPNKAPKFPLPCNLLFLLHYGALKQNRAVLKHVELTLDKMAMGGIYDQVGGGFTRYSTDIYWKVPHFEKMLYDNAQLLGLYAEAFKYFGKPHYKAVCQGINDWLEAEMQNGAGAFFSALDADSEGKEGAFYTFPESITAEIPAFADHYHTDGQALWEGKLIPVRSTESALGSPEAQGEFAELNHKLLAIRTLRERPATDDKTICSWNAMLATGFIKAGRYADIGGAMAKAEGILRFIETECFDPDTGHLAHSWKEGKTKKIGFLEDYAFLAEAYLERYAASFNEEDALRAKFFCDLAIDRFYDSRKGLFFYTADTQTDLISRPVELSDNVIPSSNAVMANLLKKLAGLFENNQYEKISDRLLEGVYKQIEEYGEGYGHWSELLLMHGIGTPEIVVAGARAFEIAAEIDLTYFPLSIRAAAIKSSSLAIFKDRHKEGHTLTYICQNRSCLAPAHTAAEASMEIEKIKKSVELP